MMSRLGTLDRLIGKNINQQTVIFLETEQYTRYEKSRIIGARALQLSMGAPPLIKVKDTNPINIAKAEFEKDVIPITVVR